MDRDQTETIFRLPDRPRPEPRASDPDGDGPTATPPEVHREPVILPMPVIVRLPRGQSDPPPAA